MRHRSTSAAARTLSRRLDNWTLYAFTPQPPVRRYPGPTTSTHGSDRVTY